MTTRYTFQRDDMRISRRQVVASLSAIGATALTSSCATTSGGTRTMYGLIGKMKTVSGQRDALISILLEGTGDMPGCLSYIIATDPADENAIWITEVWDSRESHQASLQLSSVQQAITRGRALIAGFGERFETTPVGGHGLSGA
jgi:quinol monooxygenase YgiN